MRIKYVARLGVSHRTQTQPLTRSDFGVRYSTPLMKKEKHPYLHFLVDRQTKEVN